MLPVALAMLGTGARPPTLAFLGWFGPRGLASIVFAVVVLDETELPHLQTLLLAIVAQRAGPASRNSWIVAASASG